MTFAVTEVRERPTTFTFHRGSLLVDMLATDLDSLHLHGGCPPRRGGAGCN